MEHPAPLPVQNGERRIDDLMAHAATDSVAWLKVAVWEIDSYFGDGYAATNPALVAGFMAACATHYQAERTHDAAWRIELAIMRPKVKHG
jgi:hypothetical protein